ncbi:MAG: hypothetical protein ACKV2T_10990 [Kofleriaceae bacterium]
MSGVFGALWDGEMPTWDDVGETAGTVADVGLRTALPAYGAYRSGEEFGEAAAYMHYERRDELNHVGDPSMYPSTSDLPTTVNEQNDSGWTLLSEDLSILHQDDSDDHPGSEAKFVNEDGRESVRYRNADGSYGDEVTRDDIRGTYNYVNPGNIDEVMRLEQCPAEYVARMAGHGVLDVLPWYLGGSVRGPG